MLIDVAEMLRQSLGPDGAVARLGGEEFGAVLTHRSKLETIALVDRFRAGMAGRTFVAGDTEIQVTVSIGVSQGNDRLSTSMLLSNADKALYLAKASGRNRVVHADELLALVPGNMNTEQRIAV